MSDTRPPEDQAVPDTVLPVGGAFRRGEGFEAVLEEFGPLIHSVAHRYARDADEEEDLYQEACIRIYEQCHTFQDGSLSVWIYRTADRWCRNLVRARKSRQAATERFSAASQNGRPTNEATDPWKHVLRVETNLRLRRGLAKLSARQANAFVLTQVEGYSARQAARIMDASVSTVRSNVRHARKRLREHWEEEE